MTLNENKTIKGVERITILGYEIEKGKMAPDRKRLQPLLELAAPKTLKELKQIQGLFVYYAKWTVDFSTKIKPLIAGVPQGSSREGALGLAPPNLGRRSRVRPPNLGGHSRLRPLT